jgi:hypothetical protein
MGSFGQITLNKKSLASVPLRGELSNFSILIILIDVLIQPCSAHVAVSLCLFLIRSFFET